MGARLSRYTIEPVSRDSNDMLALAARSSPTPPYPKCIIGVNTEQAGASQSGSADQRTRRASETSAANDSTRRDDSYSRRDHWNDHPAIFMQCSLTRFIVWLVLRVGLYRRPFEARAGEEAAYAAPSQRARPYPACPKRWKPGPSEGVAHRYGLRVPPALGAIREGRLFYADAVG